jgi:hypothetical protein
MNNIYPPDLTKILNDHREEISANINCIQAGQINSINISEQTAEIKLQVKRRISETEIQEYPLLVDCPIFYLQGGGAFLEMPIKANDYCLVFFCDRDIDTWWSSANIAEPKTLRKHSLSDGFALVGINPKTQVLSLSGDSVSLNASTYKVNIKNDSEELKGLIDDLIDAIKDIVTTGSPPTHTISAASQAQLIAVKTRFGLLFKGAL